jgi:hypothetical protein
LIVAATIRPEGMIHEIDFKFATADPCRDIDRSRKPATDDAAD